MKTKTEPKIASLFHISEGNFERGLKAELLDDNKLLLTSGGLAEGTCVFVQDLTRNEQNYKKLAGNYTYLGCFNKELLVFIPANVGLGLVLLYKDTLEQNNKVALQHKANTLYTVIDNQLAALCSKTDLYEQTHWTITLYDKAFLPLKPIYLTGLIPEGVNIKSVTPLNNGLIVLECSNHTLCLLEKITAPELYFTTRGTLDLLAVGNTWVGLANGDILIYDIFCANQKIWNGDGLRSTTALALNINPHKEKISNIYAIQKIYPMIDGKNLIIKTGFGIQLHNLKTGENKIIDLGSHHGSVFHVLSDGRVMIEGKMNYALNVLLAEFQENLDYKKTYPKDLVQDYCFFNHWATKNGVPGDVKTIIYTFLIEALLREQPYLLKLIQEYPALNPVEKKSGCTLF